MKEYNIDIIISIDEFEVKYFEKENSSCFNYNTFDYCIFNNRMGFICRNRAIL